MTGKIWQIPSFERLEEQELFLSDKHVLEPSRFVFLPFFFQKKKKGSRTEREREREEAKDVTQAWFDLGRSCECRVSSRVYMWKKGARMV